MIDEQRLEDLILARLSVRSKRAVTKADASKQLFSFVSSRVSAAEWRDLFGRAMERLASNGLVRERPLGITQAGKNRLANALGASSPPGVSSWRALKQKVLPRLIGHEGTVSAEAVVAHTLGVGAGERTPAQIADLWLGKKLELGNRKVTWGAVKTTLLARELGVPVRPKVEQVVRLAAAKAAGSRSGRTEDIVTALTNRWLEAADAAPRERAPAVDAGRVLGKVRDAAIGPNARRFGSGKVFISSVWEAVRSDRELHALDEATFKQLLVDAHRRGEIVLSRADLVAAMDPKDVMASETRHLNSVYHFIQIGERA